MIYWNFIKKYKDKKNFVYDHVYLLDNKDKYIIIELINRYFPDDAKDYYLE